MNNAEFYKEELKRLDNSFAVTKDKSIVACAKIKCNECIFSCGNGQTDSCGYNKTLWLISEHEEEPEIDWSRVPVDTKIFMRSSDGHWLPRYFARYFDNCVYCWTCGTTSFTADSADIRNFIRDVKLADPEDIEKYKKTPDTQNDCCIPIINEPGTRRIKLVKVTDPERELKKGDLVMVWDNDNPDLFGRYASLRRFMSYDRDDYTFESDDGFLYRHCMKIEGVRSFSDLLIEND